MKFLDRFILVIYSIVMFLLSVLTAVLLFRWLDIETVHTFVDEILFTEPYSSIVLGVVIVVILLSIKALFFKGKDERATKDGVLLQNDNGKLLISKDTLENLVINIARGFEGTENVVAKVGLDKENNLMVYVTLYVHPNVVIKDLTANIQNRIKDAIKKTSDLETKDVNVRIRNITPETKIEA